MINRVLGRMRTRRPALDDLGEHVGEVGVGLDAVELAGLHQ